MLRAFLSAVKVWVKGRPLAQAPTDAHEPPVDYIGYLVATHDPTKHYIHTKEARNETEQPNRPTGDDPEAGATEGQQPLHVPDSAHLSLPLGLYRLREITTKPEA